MARRGRSALYPWAEWADERWHRAVFGEDFSCSQASFRAQLAAHTIREANLRVGSRVLSDDGSVVFRFMRNGEELFARRPEDDGLVGVPRKAGGRPAQYPWAAWADRKWHDVFQGEDFTVAYRTFVSMLWARAGSRGLRVTTFPLEYDGKSGLMFRFLLPGEVAEERPLAADGFYPSGKRMPVS